MSCVLIGSCHSAGTPQAVYYSLQSQAGEFGDEKKKMKKKTATWKAMLDKTQSTRFRKAGLAVVP